MQVRISLRYVYFLSFSDDNFLWIFTTVFSSRENAGNNLLRSFLEFSRVSRDVLYVT